ncbi:signal recognition particle subunit SRP19/SEC65 family protein [Methanobrevibacter sp.]|uniref:signal recognition particle subunit SRP19/SEC65 family protein n=1 Tax=Methanobrevibacter sp. TaxID=66852 RepID=UPI002608BC74|nr:signal recognition particle subunit SRP19/SEC65 family protein [uncultured Methanobrevibacter sp.]
METIIWPAYIDSSKSRSDGRKISKDDAISHPKLTEIARAARKLGLSPKTEDDKSYPKFWWDDTGRIIIEREEVSKNKILVDISQSIKSLRKR